MGQVESVVLEEVRERRARPRRRRTARTSSGCSSARISPAARRSSEQKMRDELVTMLSDGPTATSLAWVFERLLRHPDKLARLREEVLRRRGRVPRRGRQGDAAPVPGRAAGDAPADRADADRRLHAGAGHDRRAVRAPDAPSARTSTRTRCASARSASSTSAAGTYTWIPFGGGVRRCVAALVRAAGDEARDRRGARTSSSCARRTRARRASTRSSVSFAPDGGARVVAIAGGALGSARQLAA